MRLCFVPASALYDPENGERFEWPGQYEAGCRDCRDD